MALTHLPEDAGGVFDDDADDVVLPGPTGSLRDATSSSSTGR